MYKFLKMLFPFAPLGFSVEGEEDGGGDGEEKEIPPPGANQELEKLQKELEALREEKASIEKEKKGIYSDYKKEQEKRRQAEASLEERERKLKEEEKSDIFENLGDEDYITGKQLKKLTNALSVRERNRVMADLKMRADERVASDEARMQEICEVKSEKFPVPYDDAINAFIELAEKDPTLWTQYDQAKFKPGGRPAELAYKIALREHPKYQKLTEEKTRERLIEEMEKNGESPKKLKSGGGGAGKRLEDMTDQEISNLSDDELDKLSRQK